VTLNDEGMQSWDRGYDTAGAQVWGAEKGAYIFVRK
jgi:CpeT protein